MKLSYVKPDCYHLPNDLHQATVTLPSDSKELSPVSSFSLIWYPHCYVFNRSCYSRTVSAPEVTLVLWRNVQVNIPATTA